MINVAFLSACSRTHGAHHYIRAAGDHHARGLIRGLRGLSPTVNPELPRALTPSLAKQAHTASVRLLRSPCSSLLLLLAADTHYSTFCRRRLGEAMNHSTAACSTCWFQIEQPARTQQGQKGVECQQVSAAKCMHAGWITDVYLYTDRAALSSGSQPLPIQGAGGQLPAEVVAAADAAAGPSTRAPARGLTTQHAACLPACQ